MRLNICIELWRLASVAAACLLTACSGDGRAPAGGSTEPPPELPPIVWRSVAVSSRHGCGLTLDGTAYCWGINGAGQLGNGTLSLLSFVPVRVKTDLKFDMLAAGLNHTCALTKAGETYCWGQANLGFLNDRITEVTSVPTRVVDVPAFKEIDAGSSTCGLAESGEMTCWEANPIPVPQGLPAFKRLAVGWSNFCGLTAEGEAHCWGSNYNGQLGRLDAQGPTVVGDGLRFRSFSVGKDHMCGVTADGAPHCWGLNERGQLGIGTTSSFEPATRVATALGFDDISIGAQSSCGLVGRTAYCWAFNQHGQVGDGTNGDRLTPVPVSGGHNFAALDVGEFAPDDALLQSATCGVTVSGALYCWGSNRSGQLGFSTNAPFSNMPVRVVEPMPDR